MLDAATGAWAWTRSRVGWVDRDAAAVAALVLAMAVSAALILYWGRGQSFYADDWIYLINYRRPSLQDWLYPQNGHLVVLPVLLFQAVVKTFGATSFLPFRLMALSFVLLCGGLLFCLARRRVGPGLALAAAVLVLFLGAAWEVLLAPYAHNVLISAAAGLGTLLCLDRRDLRGDLAACALLAVSLASFSLGIVFAAIAAVELLLRPGRRGLRRSWVVLVPGAPYLAWVLWARQFHQSSIDLADLGSLPIAIGEAAAAACASIFGLFKTPGPEVAGFPDLGVRTEWGIPIAVALAAALVVRLRRGPRIGPRGWALLAGLLVYWTLIGLSINEARAPNSSRYVYPAAILLALLAVELGATARISKGWRLAIGALLAFSLVSNVAQMRVAGGYFRDEGHYNRAQLAALELVRGEVSPTFVVEYPSSNLLPHSDMTFQAHGYFAATDELGSPAFSLGELEGAGPEQRRAADQLLGRALRLHAEPVRRLPAPGPGQVAPGRIARHATTAKRGGCVLVTPDRGREARVSLRLPPGGFAYRVAEGSEATVELGRFGDGFAVEVAPVLGPAAVRIPADRSGRSWRALLRPSERILVCSA